MQNSFYHIPGLPVSIALLADLHEKDYSFLSDLYPVDLIAVAGDVLYGSAPEDGSSAAERVIPFLSACADLDGKESCERELPFPACLSKKEIQQ